MSGVFLRRLHASIIPRKMFSTNTSPITDLLISYGVSNPDVDKIITKQPDVLSMKIDDLTPTLELFRTNGFTDDRLSHLLSSKPSVLLSSLADKMAPIIEALGSLLDRRLLESLCRNPRLLENGARNKLLPNVEALRQQGMPESRIKELLATKTGRPVLFADPGRFAQLLARLKEMGYDLRTPLAARSLVVLSQPDRLWHAKLRLLQSFGWSGEDVLVAFRQYPECFLLSENNIRETVEFLVGNFRWTPAMISRHAVCLCYSLKRRIVPRVSVFNAISAARLGNAMMSETRLLTLGNRQFVERVVKKYQDRVPNIWDAYNGKLELMSSDIESNIKPAINRIARQEDVCGSPESMVPWKIRFVSPDHRSSVIDLLLSYGVSKPDVDNIIRKKPNVVLMNIDELTANLEFLRTNGFTEDRLSYFLSSRPSVLSFCLPNKMAPVIEVLGSLLDQRLLEFICRNPRMLQNDVQNKLLPNVEALRKQGMPEVRIKELVATKKGKAVLFADPDRFVQLLALLKEMGYDLHTRLAARSLIVLSQPDHCWHAKLRLLQSLGWSGEDIVMAFRQYPECFLYSEDNIREKVEFLVNNFHWTPTVIARHAFCLCYSVKRRIIPRMSVFNAILSARLASTTMPEIKLFAPGNQVFIERYVKKYQDKVPNIWDAYHGKLELISSEMESNIEPNIRTLKKFKVPNPTIRRLVREKSRALLINYLRFRRAMKGLKGMKFQFSSKMFPDALVVLGTMRDAVSIAKLTFYRNLGWTDLDIVSALKKQPYYLTAHDAKVRSLVSFFKTKLKWGPSDLSESPDLLLLDFEKVIIHRYAIFMVLLFNRCVRNNVKPSLFLIDENKFYNLYVDKYKDRVPGLLEIHQSSKIE